ncbi:MAG TPA: hypothetical protein VF450_09430 [Noviherbaspirillum sp.]
MIMLLSMLMTQVSFAACRHLHAAAAFSPTPVFASVAKQDPHATGCKNLQAKSDLCATYVQAAKTTIDTPQLPFAPSFSANAFVLVLPPPSAPIATGVRALTPVRAPDPPVCIRHCSFQL